VHVYLPIQRCASIAVKPGLHLHLDITKISRQLVKGRSQHCEGFLPAFKGPRLVDTDCVRAVVTLVSAFVHVHTGVSIASEARLGNARVIGAKVSAFFIGVAGVSLCTEIGTLANHAAFVVWPDPLIFCTVQFGTILDHVEHSAIQFAVLCGHKG